LIEHAMLNRGARIVCIREVQKTLKDSAKRVVEDKIQAFGVGHMFDVNKDWITTPGGGTIIFQGMQDHTAESIKSLEGFSVAWVEEAQSLSERSLELLRPTIRAEGSEIWFSWNPRHARDPVDKMLRGPNCPRGATVVRANWTENPWFTSVLEEERQADLELNPDGYGHIWEGEYVKVYKGAYFASLLAQAETDGRIDVVPRDPLLPLYAWWDIGGTSGRSDATAIWIGQIVGPELRMLDYYEAVGQEFLAHIEWMRGRGYKPICVLPHDGRKHDMVYAVTPEGVLRTAGLEARVIQNQGRSAALRRIDAGRRVLPMMRFNRDTTEAGRQALVAYHEKRDEARDIGLGPEHDWSSHAADAFGMACEFFLSRPATRDKDRSKPFGGVLKGVV
jgi:phage terminase large subunit